MTNETKHTPEPWAVQHGRHAGPGGEAVEVFVMRAQDDVAICADVLDPETCVPSEINARRIVACVNACAGIPVEALEAGALRAALGHADDILGHTDPECDEMNCDTKRGLTDALRALGALT